MKNANKDVGIEANKTHTGKRRINRSGKLTVPFQLWWDEETKERFTALVKAYDPLMPRATAIIKLINYAIEDGWIPGYIRKQKTMINKAAQDIEDMKNKID